MSKVLSNAQVATLQRVLAVTNNVLPRLEMLEALANINVSMKPRVQELRAQREYLAQLATAALEIERQISGPIEIPAVKQSSGVEWGPATKGYVPPTTMAAPQEWQPPTEYTPTNIITTGTPQPPRPGAIFVANVAQLPAHQVEQFRVLGMQTEYVPGVGWYAYKV